MKSRLFFEGPKPRYDCKCKTESQHGIACSEKKTIARFSTCDAKDQNERGVGRIRIYVIDQILTLRCLVKRYRMAFVDFEGCFSLTCSGSLVHFCA